MVNHSRGITDIYGLQMGLNVINHYLLVDLHRLRTLDPDMGRRSTKKKSKKKRNMRTFSPRRIFRIVQTLVLVDAKLRDCCQRAGSIGLEIDP